MGKGHGFDTVTVSSSLPVYGNIGPNFSKD